MGGSRAEGAAGLAGAACQADAFLELLLSHPRAAARPSCWKSPLPVRLPGTVREGSAARACRRVPGRVQHLWPHLRDQKDRCLAGLCRSQGTRTGDCLGPASCKYKSVPVPRGPASPGPAPPDHGCPQTSQRRTPAPFLPPSRHSADNAPEVLGDEPQEAPPLLLMPEIPPVGSYYPW